MKKVGFIGCGNMGSAILKGALYAKAFEAGNTYVHTASVDSLQRLQKEYQIQPCVDNRDVYRQSDIIILAIKPYMFEAVIDELKDIYDENKVIVSIAAGITMDKLSSYFQQDHIKIVRVMPNTPSFVNMGASGICCNAYVSESELAYVKTVFEAIGIVAEVSEEEIHAVVAVSGSSPAYAFMFLDAIVREGMNQGLSYQSARKLAAQTLKGAAEMVLTTDESLEQLKKNVCSPNGTTLEAVYVLEAEGFEKIIAKAMIACANKSRRMSE